MDGVRTGDGEPAVGAELRRLRTDRQLSLAQLARQVHYSKGYLSKLETGEKRITPDVARRCDEVLDTGGALAALVPTRTRRSEPIGECPYRGLAAFGERDVRWFFGRERATADLLSLVADRLGGGGPVAVVAPSGAGKSSLLRAGLLPALARGALPGSADWPVAVCTPTAEPLAALRTVLDRLAGSERFALVVDQFEETFTDCPDEDERRAYIDALCAVAERPHAVVVLGVRADLYGRCLDYPRLLAGLRAGQLPLGPMTADELRDAIVRPAKAAGIELEPGLVELLLSDLEPSGALPLLSHALLATWQQSDGRRLTVDGYRRTGGIRQAAATTAERAYGQLDAEHRRAARQLLLRLVRVEEDGEHLRRIHRDRLLGGATEQVLEAFSAARLLTVDADHVRIAHEAMLRAWPRLREWIQANRADLRTHQQLADAAEEWRHDQAMLYRGARLALVRDWIATPPSEIELSAAERAFLTASIDADEGQRHAERRRTRQLRRLVAALTVLLVIAVAVGGLAVYQRDELGQQQRAALANALAARSAALAAKQPDAAITLALAGYRQAATAQALSALLSAQGQYFAGRLAGHTASVRDVAVSAEGRTVATASDDGTIRLWNPVDHRQTRLIAPHAGRVRALALRGSTLAAATEDNVVRLWDLRTQAAPVVVRAAANDVELSPDGTRLATAGRSGTLTLWSTAGQQIAVVGSQGAPVTSIAFSPDGRSVATGGKDGTARVWKVGQPLVVDAHAGWIRAVAISPDGRTLATGGPAVQLWDLASGRRIATLTGHTADVTSVAFSPDGRTLASASLDETVRLWDLPSAQPVATLTGHGQAVNAVAYAPDGRTVFSASGDDTVLLWDLAGATVTPRPVDQRFAVDLSPDGRLLASTGGGPTVTLTDALRHTQVAVLSGHTDRVGAVAFAPDGRTLATGSWDRTIRLWDVATHRPVAVLAGHTGRVRSLAFSPDGRTLASTGADGALRLWNLASHQAKTVLSGIDVERVAVSPTGRTLAVAAADGTIRLVDTASGRLVATMAAHVASGRLAYVDEGLLAASGPNDSVQLWSLTTHRVVGTLAGHAGVVNAIAVSPDGREIATGAKDDSTQIWDVGSRTLVATLTGPTAPISDVVFGHDGRTLAATSSDTTVRLFDLDAARVAAQLCQRIDPIQPGRVADLDLGQQLDLC
ncbi:helix-turn-helix domain-containing protein [Fodinicola acaciae]|uniref:nSTAND1 domain-containing NTPase n=1 Tax=Fodinicola acaciae TaxID=2681555 RepID=UPI0013D41091|nr:helix-turn-helix domain-containing protein [Fodinicola acaciae]